MTIEEQTPPDSSDAETTPDAPTSDDPQDETTEPVASAVGEDDPSLLGHDTRAIAPPQESDATPSEVEIPATTIAEADDSSDAGAAPADTEASKSEAVAVPLPLDRELSTTRIAGELHRIEKDVRSILENCDSRRKRKLAGSKRWAELEEDILSWRFSGRIAEEDLRQLQRLVAARHYLFNRLRFLAFTRPTWNS